LSRTLGAGALDYVGWALSNAILDEAMTRFKELRRIKHALEHKNKEELQWALWYVKSRLSTARLKVHIKHWQNLRRKIEAALDSGTHSH
jgi:hypothetical protein